MEDLCKIGDLGGGAFWGQRIEQYMTSASPLTRRTGNEEAIKAVVQDKSCFKNMENQVRAPNVWTLNPNEVSPKCHIKSGRSSRVALQERGL